MASGSPVRSLPKVMSKPTATWRTPRPSTSTSRDELAVGHAGHLGVERQEVEDVDAQRLQRAGLLVAGSSAGTAASSGWKSARGCGSKLITPSGAPSSRGGLGGVGDHPLVAAVHAVEVAAGHAPRRGPPRGRSAPAVDDLQTLIQALRRGTMTTASPSTTVLPSTRQTVVEGDPGLGRRRWP